RPHPRPVAARGIAEASPARGLEHDPVAGVEGGNELGGHRFLSALGTMDHRARHGTIASPGAALWGNEVALAAVGHAHSPGEHFALLDEAEPAALRTRPPGIAAQRDLMHTDRCIELVRFGRQVHAVCCVRLDDVDTVFGGAGPRAPRNKLARDIAS